MTGTTSGSLRTHAFGVEQLGGRAVTPETRYDLASLTKVMATLPAVLQLAGAGHVDLDGPLVRYFSNIHPGLEQVTPRQLLSHSSGLPAFSRVFTVTQSRLVALGATLMTEPVGPPGPAVYSDVGFMLLGALVERVTRQRLDAYVQEHVFSPLGLHSLHFTPDGPHEGVSYAATEDCSWRNRLLVGEVHDENCSAWEGVSGHAGLFGTAEDVAGYARAWLRLDERLAPPALLRASLQEHAVTADGERRGLGWVLGPASWAGDAAGYGHTGYTGTSIWCDPDTDRFAVLLTNRVHPDRNVLKAMNPVRRQFHEAAWAEEA